MLKEETTVEQARIELLSSDPRPEQAESNRQGKASAAIDIGAKARISGMSSSQC